MNGKSASVLVLLMFCVLLLGFPDAVFLVKGETQGWQVDVYTQNEPCNGVGLGEPSDAFASQETVLLYANVTYNVAPVQNVLVSFSVEGPPNSVQNFTLSLSAVTTAEGVAETGFTIPWPAEDPEIITFGVWSVVAYAKNSSDFLIFRVGWIVELVSLSVVDEDPPQGGWLDVQLSLINIAMTPKNATLSLVFTDSLENFIGCLIIDDFIVDIDGANLSARFQVPYWAAVGVASVHASVYTPSGAPYSPITLSTTFLISLLGDLNGDNAVDIVDVAMAAKAFGSNPEHPRWNPLADINKDGKVDIMDIAIVSRNFGSTYP